MPLDTKDGPETWQAGPWLFSTSHRGRRSSPAGLAASRCRSDEREVPGIRSWADDLCLSFWIMRKESSAGSAALVLLIKPLHALPRFPDHLFKPLIAAVVACQNPA